MRVITVKFSSKCERPFAYFLLLEAPPPEAKPDI